MLTAIDAAISTIELMRTISGLIFTPSVSSLKNVRRPALDAGIGALFFLLLIPRPVVISLFLSVTLGVGPEGSADDSEPEASTRQTYN